MSKLRAGAAKVCIDPTPDMFPIPRAWGVYFDGICSSIYVRALAVSNEDDTQIIVSFEAGNGADELRAEMAERFNISGKNFLFCSTHSHGSPDAHGKPNEMSSKGDYSSFERMRDIVHDAAIQAVDEAIKGMRPARYGYGEGLSFVNVNRDLQLEDGTWAQADNFAGHSDKTLAAMKFVDEDGKLIAAVLNHCTHPNTTYLGVDVDGKSKTCGDFVGFTAQFLEKRYGDDAVILWTIGAAGDQNAIQCYRGDRHYVGEENVNYPDPNGLSYRYAEYLGEIHAIDCDKVLRSIECRRGGIELKAASTDILFDGQLPPEGVSFSQQILTAQNAIRTLARLHPELVKDGRIIDRTLRPYLPSGAKLPCEMQLFILGDVAIITLAAEPYCMLGTLIKQHSPLRNTFVITNSGGHGNRVGYIQDDDSATHPVFQHFDRVYPGHSNNIVLDGASKLFDELLGE